MAVKKTAAPVKKATAKKAAVSKKESLAGKSYVCGVCGLAVTVDEDCGCVEECDIICCGEQMKPKRSRAKAAVKPKAAKARTATKARAKAA